MQNSPQVIRRLPIVNSPSPSFAGGEQRVAVGLRNERSTDGHRDAGDQRNYSGYQGDDAPRHRRQRSDRDEHELSRDSRGWRQADDGSRRRSADDREYSDDENRGRVTRTSRDARSPDRGRDERRSWLPVSDRLAPYDAEAYSVRPPRAVPAGYGSYPHYMTHPAAMYPSPAAWMQPQQQYGSVAPFMMPVPARVIPAQQMYMPVPVMPVRRSHSLMYSQEDAEPELEYDDHYAHPNIRRRLNDYR